MTDILLRAVLTSLFVFSLSTFFLVHIKVPIWVMHAIDIARLLSIIVVFLGLLVAIWVL